MIWWTLTMPKMKIVLIFWHTTRSWTTGEPRMANEMVKVLCNTGDETWEPIRFIKEDEKMTLSKYLHDHDLLYVPGCRCAMHLTKNPKKFIILAKLFAAQAKKCEKHYKHGVKVPWKFKEAVAFDKENGNILWQEAVEDEMWQIVDFKTFKPLPKGSKPPMDHTFIPIHLSFDVKFDPRRKAWLVAVWNWTYPPDDEIYSGVVLIDSARMSFLVVEPNDL